MNRIIALLGMTFAALVCAAPLTAQQRRLSPHETISKRIDGNRVTIVYGRPYLNDPHTHQPRKIWGKLVPFGKVWRLGADEATMLVTQKPLDLGGTEVPAGAYTLFLLPKADGSAQLIVNREIGQWGIDPYHPERELGRISLQRRSVEKPVTQFTIAIEKAQTGGGVITLSWDQEEYSVPYSVKG